MTKKRYSHFRYGALHIPNNPPVYRCTITLEASFAKHQSKEKGDSFFGDSRDTPEDFCPDCYKRTLHEKKQLIEKIESPWLYEFDLNGGEQYKSTIVGKAICVPYNFYMNTRDDKRFFHAGDYVLLHNDCYYAFEKDFFEKNFVRQAINGNTIKLTRSLGAQKKWAEINNEDEHLEDINARMVAKRLEAKRPKMIKINHDSPHN